MRKPLFLIGVCSTLLLGSGSLLHQGAAQDAPRKDVASSRVPEAGQVTELWTFAYPEELQAQIYQAAILPDRPPTVLASTPDHVLRIQEQAVSLIRLRSEGRQGESAILPAPLIRTAFENTRIGILVHDHHAIETFKVVDAAGEVLLTLNDPRHFHYRLAPDGESFVGIDAHGEHTGLTAESVVYRFFNGNGKPVGEVRSSHPQPVDSRYAPDGRSFLINSRKAGLAAHDVSTGERLWTIQEDVKFFASSNSPIGRAVVSQTASRSVAQLYEKGTLQWVLDLKTLSERETVRNLGISPDGASVVVTGDTHVVMMGPAQEAPLGTYRVDPTLTINSVAVNDLGVVAIGAQKRDLSGHESAAGKVLVLDRAGKVLYERQTQHARSNAWIPTVDFDPSGRFLMVRTLESMTLLDVGGTDQ